MPTLPNYDRWKTAAPEPDPAVCVVCGDRAYDRSDPEDGPYAGSVDGDGVTCSPKCAALDALSYTGDAHRSERLENVREAVREGTELPEVTLHVEADAEGLGPLATLTGEVWEDGEDAVIVSGVHRDQSGREWDEPRIEWARVVDVVAVPHA